MNLLIQHSPAIDAGQDLYARVQACTDSHAPAGDRQRRPPDLRPIGLCTAAAQRLRLQLHRWGVVSSHDGLYANTTGLSVHSLHCK